MATTIDQKIGGGLSASNAKVGPLKTALKCSREEAAAPVMVVPRHADRAFAIVTRAERLKTFAIKL